MNKLLRRTIIDVDLPNGTTANQFNFPDQPYLRNRLIKSIKVSQSAASPLSGRSNLGYFTQTAGIGLTTYPAYLSLYDRNGNLFVQDRPIIDLIEGNILSTSAPSQGIYNADSSTDLVPVEIVWTKCFLFFPTAPTLTGYTFSFIVNYY